MSRGTAACRCTAEAGVVLGGVCGVMWYVEVQHVCAHCQQHHAWQQFSHFPSSLHNIVVVASFIVGQLHVAIQWFRW